METLILISAGLFGYAMAYMIVFSLKKDEIAVTERVKKLISRETDQASKPQDGSGRRIRLWNSSRSFASDRLRGDLQSAGILMRPEEFLIGWMLLAAVPMLLIMIITSNTALALVVALIGAILPPIIVSRAKEKRLELFSKQLGEALPVIGNSLRSGFTFQQSMENVYNNMPDPLAYEFGKAIREMQYGMPFDEAVTRLGERMQNKDLDLLVSAVIIQGRVGGNLAELIDIIGDTIKDRIKLQRDVKTMTGAGKLSGIILGLLPVGLMAFLSILNPDYLSGFVSSSMGMVMLAVGMLMEIIGFTIILKMTNIKY